MGAMTFGRVASISAVLIFTGPVAAQEALPDPATISVPDVGPSADPKVAKEGNKFFFFHNPSVGFADAYADISECRTFLASNGVPALPTFRPWVEPVKRKDTAGVAPYGLVGAVIASIVLPKMERALRSNKLRRCMEPRGYRLYPIAEADWDRLNEGDEKMLVAMQAKLASGPKPQIPEVSE
jgi:hypothetical protein